MTLILLLTSLSILVLFVYNIGIIYGSEHYSQNLNTHIQFKLVTPPTNLTNRLDNPINDAFLPGIKNYSGTIADGVSKLLLVVKSNHALKFSINGTKYDNITNGKIIPFNQPSIVNL